MAIRTLILVPFRWLQTPLLQQLDVRTLIVPALRMLVNLGLQNAELVQEILASRGVQAAFTHLIKFVLGKYLVASPPPFSYSSGGGGGGGTGSRGASSVSDGQCRDEDVLNWAIRSIGLFTHGHAANQDAMHWGEPPTILSLLVKSCPFRYFSNPQLQVRARVRGGGGGGVCGKGHSHTSADDGKMMRLVIVRVCI